MTRDDGISGSGWDGYEPGEIARSLQALEPLAHKRIQGIRGRRILTPREWRETPDPTTALCVADLVRSVAEGIADGRHQEYPGESLDERLRRSLDQDILRYLFGAEFWDPYIADLRSEATIWVEEARRHPLVRPGDERSDQLPDSTGSRQTRLDAVLRRAYSELLDPAFRPVHKKDPGEALEEALSRIVNGAFVREHLECRGSKELTWMSAEVLKVASKLHRHYAVFLNDQRVANSHAAQDLAQEAFVRVYSGRRQWNPAAVDLFGLLCGVAKSCLWSDFKRVSRRVDQLRQIGLRHASLDAHQEGERLLEDVLSLPSLPGFLQNPVNPQEKLIMSRAREVVVSLFEDDPEAQQILGLLLDGYRPQDIFASEGGTESARYTETQVRNAIKRIRRRVRSHPADILWVN